MNLGLKEIELTFSSIRDFGKEEGATQDEKRAQEHRIELMRLRFKDVSEKAVAKERTDLVCQRSLSHFWHVLHER